MNEPPDFFFSLLLHGFVVLILKINLSRKQQTRVEKASRLFE